ncbi:MAG: hypothetical protein U0L67_00295 [Paludibacteraceae bacterium]|nr:hypothetical protein [Paludibacteraceae bacterium]
MNELKEKIADVISKYGNTTIKNTISNMIYHEGISAVTSKKVYEECIEKVRCTSFVVEQVIEISIKSFC